MCQIVEARLGVVSPRLPDQDTRSGGFRHTMASATPLLKPEAQNESQHDRWLWINTY